MVNFLTGFRSSKGEIPATNGGLVKAGRAGYLMEPGQELVQVHVVHPRFVIGEETLSSRHQGEVSRIAWSPDGRKLSFPARCLSTGQPRRAITQPITQSGSLPTCNLARRTGCARFAKLRRKLS